ncbi:hypothetical protein KL906_003564 [Ogataea polymorpha]|uniref:Vps72/YL1 C-terminal domain-containing protein n=2 Tax=Ogataea polymorpha TaxID=460523 RepID=A0A9P8NUS3_9ASCO|nr:hypothetical protein KL906_003564 [Ogataea polymorpha]KAG7915415.1 hypothetical protein KL927_003691 [Ogataea polymorpha]KAG7933018.1 hypothetical protein KL934_003673 [Ogataea polymorpha]KAH3659577.1 hypothetical protein OGATHE_005622 [Ogataea polymorpha]
MSSSEEEFESLIATRERRANAGSRLKKLLEAEEDEVLGDDDENVQLLFAEEGEDNEWSDESEQSEQEEDEEDEEGNETGGAEEEAGSGSPDANSDEMLSSSELSASDTDESEGERELQKEQKRRRKKIEIPAIRRKPTVSAPRKRRKVDLETGDRRLSTRTTTAQNTQAIQEKLVKMKERQSHTKTRVREEYVEKTLEENLEEAKVTEEMNTLSLNLFFQQEVEKKKKQRDLMNSKRFRLMEYISFQSFGKLVTPQDELDRIREEKEREELARRTTKRRGRRRKSEIERARLEAERQQQQQQQGDVKQEEQDRQEEVFDETTVVKEETKDINEETSETGNEATAKEEEIKEETKQETKQDTEEAVEEAIEQDEVETKAVPVEGPPQRVAVQFIESHLRKDITRLELKTILFGPQSIVPGPHRDPHAQTIYTIKRDFQKELDLKKVTKERDAVYEKLLQLPKFGETYHTVEDLGVAKQTDEHVINITTPAPLGIYLPNGAKKQCPINGEDAMYYDPSNGVPYNSVEGYKVLKHVAEGGYFWTQIDAGGVNSLYKGGVGCYFGRWDDRHAQGVPEGFAG